MNRISRLTLIVALLGLTVASASGFHSSQQQTTRFEIDLPEVVAEVKEAYDRYNEAINSGNIAVLNATFHNDPRTIRYVNSGLARRGAPTGPPAHVVKDSDHDLWSRFRGGFDAHPPCQSTR